MCIFRNEWLRKFETLCFEHFNKRADTVKRLPFVFGIMAFRGWGILQAWEAIQKTLNHIEEHICEDIQIEELAEIASLSLFYYQRLFSRLVKCSVREYIKLRRLSRACETLRDKRCRILDVALEYGFSSHETFTRAFKDAYGITPVQYRNGNINVDSFMKPDLLLTYVMVDEGVPLISEGIVLEYNRKTLTVPIHFLGVKGYWRFTPGRMLGERTGVSEPAAIWDMFINLLDVIPGIPDGRKIGVTYQGDAPEGHTTYFAGAEVEVEATNDDRFALWQLPARDYVVCQYEAEDHEQLIASMGKMMKFTRFWLKTHGLRADGFFPEIYGSCPDADHAYMEMWIPFRERDNN